VRRYLLSWRELFLREPHLPSPAMMALFGWLVDHIPDSTGTPALLHGDIGFHNFLLDDGKLQAVVDWEFGHIGDAAEDLAYVRNTLGGQIDWEAFLKAYQAAGGPPVSPERLHFFQIWGHLRNACASNLVSAKLYARQVDDLKGIVLPHVYIPQFMQAAQALIASAPGSNK
jgi:aminoglycoside phosphotransferase (APT) family kinase protein